MENYKVCAIRGIGIGIEPSGTGINVDYCRFSQLKSAGNCIKRILAGHNVTLKKSGRVEATQVSAFIEATGGELLPTELSPQKFVDIIRATSEEVIMRYSSAFVRQESLARLGTDTATLKLNKLAWKASKNDAEFLIAPDTVAEWPFEAVDPSLLECPEPDGSEYRRIEAALVTGARMFNSHVRNLLCAEDPRKIVISIDDPAIAEIIHTTTLTEAQQLWRGDNRVSANVWIRTGQLAEVAGGITLTT